MNNEVWRPVVGYEGFYEVSSFGRVRSLGSPTQWSRWKGYKGAELRGTIATSGYRQFCLRRDGRERAMLGHALVAAAFLGSRPLRMEVCHLNGDRLDNRIENLRYDTRAANAAHAIRHGTLRRRETGHRAAKLSPEQVAVICASQLPHSSLGRRYGVAVATIIAVRRGGGWVPGDGWRKTAAGRWVCNREDLS